MFDERIVKSMPATALDPRIRSLMANRIAEPDRQHRWWTGLLGDHPSQYSRSPLLWNAAFARLGLDARYVPFDIPEDHLDSFVGALRQTPSVLGINVTVPYKQRVIPLLDELDPVARSIGATNCIERTADGRLIGHNTDAEGALACLELPNPGQEPFFSELAGRTVMLIGTGGAGRAVATALLPRLGATGQLLLANRTMPSASDLARTLDSEGRRVTAIEEQAIARRLPEVDLVINASTRGQAGFFTRADGWVTCLEPYSPLASADPAFVDPGEFPDPAACWRAWYLRSLPDIRQNERESVQALAQAPDRTRWFDLIYAPAESALLRLARWTGHRTLNGADMILHQAVAGFVLLTAPVLDVPGASLRSEIEAAMRGAREI